MNDNFIVKIEGWKAETLTDAVVSEIVNSINIEQFKAEIKNKIIKELKSDILNSKEINMVVQSSSDKADKIIESRVNQAITKKIEQIQNIDIGSFQLTLK